MVRGVYSYGSICFLPSRSGSSSKVLRRSGDALILGQGQGCLRTILVRTDCIVAGGFSEEAEMRVMREGRTIDRAVWLAKRGGGGNKLILGPWLAAGL